MMKTIDSLTAISKQTDASDVALAVYASLLELLEELEDADWARPTECPDWTVADMVGHLIGAAKAGASKWELVRQVIWGMRHRAEYDGISSMRSTPSRYPTTVGSRPRNASRLSVRSLREQSPAACVRRI